MITTVGGKTFAQYLSAIQSGNAQHLRISFGSRVIDENHISIDGLRYQCYLNPNEDVDFGTAAMSEVEVDLINKDRSLTSINFTGEFAVSLGVEIDGTTVYQQIGIFIGEQPDKTHDDVIHLVGHDRMQLFEQDAEAFFKNEATGKTLAQYFSDLCTYCGVTAVAIPSYAVNTGRIFERHPMDGAGFTCRDVLASLAQAMGCHARINMNGQCELIWFTTHTSDYRMTNADLYSRDIAEYVCPAVQKVQVKVTENDIGVIVGNGDNGYIIVNNPFLYGESDEELRPYVTNLYNRIHDFGTYIPATVEGFGTWLVEPGDIISIQNGEGSYQNLVIFNVSIFWNGSASITYESTGRKKREELSASNKDMIQIGMRFHELINDIDMLQSTIGSLRYGTHYVQWNDPSLTEEIRLGDTWTKNAEGLDTWGDLTAYTWDGIGEYAWGDFIGPVTYVWDGNQWIVTSDQRMTVYMQTMIDQTTEHINLIASEQVQINEILAETSALLSVVADKILIGVTAKGVITEQSYIEIMNDHIIVDSDGYIQIRAGATFTVESNNFTIDAEGNVIMTGEIHSAAGDIGGWDINPNSISSGSGVSYICLGYTEIETTEEVEGETVDVTYTYNGIWMGGMDPEYAPLAMYMKNDINAYFQTTRLAWMEFTGSGVVRHEINLAGLAADYPL